MRSAIALAAALLSGCTVGPNYRQPQIETPATWSNATTQPTTQPVQLSNWWTTFNDPVLNSLINHALSNNLDLRIAAARLREARFARRVVGSDRWPTIDATGSYTRSRQSENVADFASGAAGAGHGGGGASPTGFDFAEGDQDLWQAGFDASWELDLFGRVRRSIEAADADLAAFEENRRDVLLTLLSEVTRNYVELRGFQRQLDIAQKNIASQRDTLELTQTKFNAGLTGELDVARAQAQVSTTSAEVPDLEASIRRTIHRIGVLLGRPPATFAEELAAPSPTPLGPAQIPAGLPSDLLRRRPDIRRAERELAASTARVGVATSELFPRLQLTGSAGLASDRLGNIGSWDSRFFSIGPSLTLPLFDRGRIRAAIGVENARTDQALSRYEQTVLAAFEDVENALITYAKERQRRDVLTESVTANRRAVELSTELYNRGLADFLNVLESQRSLFQAEDLLARSETASASALVALYKSLAGGWEENK